jgi:probable rRNA maturation factor
LAIVQATKDCSFSYIGFNLLKKWLYRVIKEEDFIPGDITFVFTSDDYLLELNRKYLQHDFYTDVISFDFSYDNIVSGDIFISLDRVNENAGIYNVDFHEELDRVMLHGLLHLLGYHDSNDLEISVMRSKESDYLKARSPGHGFTPP